MQIEVLSVAVEDKGKYKVAEVAYKGQDGKVTSKKVMSFGASADVFKQIKDAHQGAKYDVTTIKNAQGYWDWTALGPGGATGVTTSSPAPGASPRSTYETPEERATRQLLIVKQSSVNQAIELIKLNNPKGGVTIENVLGVASRFEDHVFGRSNSITDLESDVI